MGNVVLQKCSSTTDVNAVNNFKRFVNGNQPFSISAKDLEGITEIPDRAFENCKYLTSIELPSSLTSIGDRAFYGCSNLREVISESNTFNNLQSVGIDAFTGCNNLQIGRPVYTFLGNSYQVSFPYQDGAIGKLVCVPTMHQGYIVSSVYADELRINGTTHWVFLPSTLPQIGARGVGALTELEHITIPNNVTSIDVYAFGGDHNLASISFGKNVTSIGEGAFSQCWNLASINYGGTKAEWELISLGTNWDSQTGPYTIHCTDGDIRKDLLSYTLNQDGRSYSCTGIGSETSRDIVISARHNGLPVTGIGDSAFSSANTLLSVTIPNSVTSIGSSAFWGCGSIASIYYNGDISGWCTMSGLNNIMQYGRSDKALYINNQLISGQLSLPNNLASISDYAFYYCTAITSVVAPDNNITIGNNAFYLCSNITSITGSADNIVTIGQQCGTTYDAVITGTNMSEYVFQYKANIRSATITDSIISISANAFQYSGLTSATIGSGVTSIGNGAFYYCPITSITIPDNVINLGNYTFGSCTDLTSITLGSGITNIGERLFVDCSNLVSITYNGTVAQWLSLAKGSRWDSGTGNYTIYCTNGEISKDGTITYYPTEGLEYILNSDNQSYNCNGIGTATDTDIVIASVCDGLPVTSIGDNAFYNCRGLTSITILDSVTIIDNFAFYACSGLTSITIPDSVTSIGDYVFRYCSGLTSITYNGTIAQWGVISLGVGWNFDTGNYMIYCTDGTIAKDGTITYYPTEGLAYTLNQDGQSYSCTGIGTATDTDIIIAPEYSGLPVTSIGDSAFKYRDRLTSVTIPNSVTSIEAGAFWDCSGLTSVTIPDSVTSIGNNAFSNCTGLTSITIPDSVTSIGNYTFYDCTGLTSITIPDGVTSIGDSAFYNCSSLTSVTYNGTIAQWGVISLGVGWNINTGTYTIYCTNGEIAKNGTITYDTTDGLAYTLNQDGQSYSCTGIGTATDTDIVVASEYSGLPVTSISDQAFYNTPTLKSVVIPGSIINIGDDVFANCDNLKVAELLPGVLTIGDRVFDYCTNLSLMIIPNTTTTIGSNVFRYCGSLQSITIPNSVTSIGSGAFMGCTVLSSISLSNALISIDSDMFAYCYVLTSIIIPNGVTSIGAYSFGYCNRLTSLTYNDTINQWNSISKGNNWDTYTGDYTIHCTDGDIPKQQQ